MSRFLLSLACLLASDHPGMAAEKPNIVFFLVDDLGVRDLSNEGSRFHETPNVDRIARMGMKFTRGYAACQVCSPSRASILTGKYPVNHGITTYIGDASGESWRSRKRFDSHFPAEYQRQLAASEQTLAEVLRDAGYKTFFAGKWHLGDKGSWPQDHGFSINKGGYHVGGPYGGGYFSPYGNPNLGDGPDGESLTLRLGRETADFIDANKDDPFLAYLSFYTVHAPIQTTSNLWKKYRDKAVAAGLPEERFRFDRRLAVRQVQDCPIYGGMVEAMDEAVGIVLASLEKNNLLDKTIICFTSDNGGVSSGDAFSTSNLPLRGGKGRQWEGGIREPYYLHAPGTTKAGSVSDVPVSGIDWYPTLLELASVAIPKGQQVDGVSLVPLLKGEPLEQRPLYWHYPHYGNQGGEPSSILMEGDWKLIFYHEDGRHELYHLGNDVGERNDVLASHPQRAERMKRQLAGWLASTEAKFPTKDLQFDPAKRDARWKQLSTKGMEQLERRHARYLEANYKPNADWWGSEID
ncbi:Arylsulfatase precursor [Planctomycetes bacterium Pan216]|uniref:Arylsulfatase n=1 Tax=Kolteria novifilia TaxID=2527975 RepID=A0A518AXA0_9BACT|nr:Arylsulfatase precursor [Planctomycetes bacterium Pan216]